MSDGPPQVVVVTGSSGGGESAEAWTDVDVVHWLRHDVGVRTTVLSWRAHPLADHLATIVPRRSPAGAAGDRVAGALQGRGWHRAAGRVRDSASRGWLLAHCSTPILLVGASAAAALPWLGPRRAPTVWLLGAGQAATAAADARAHAGSLDHVLVPRALDAAALTAGGGMGSRVEVLGPFHPGSPTGLPSRPCLGVVGDLDDAHGADLVPRLLWGVRRDLGTPITLRWASLGAGAPGPMVRSDLRRLGLDQDVTFDRAPVDLTRWIGSISVIALPWRRSIDATVVERAAAAGRSTWAFEPAEAVAGLRTNGICFPDVAGLSSAIAAALAPGALAADAADLRARHGSERASARVLDLLFGGAA